MNRLLITIPLILAAPAVAQQQRPDTARVAPVIVTATRSPLAQANLPVAVVVIPGENLRLRGITSVGEAVTYIQQNMGGT